MKRIIYLTGATGKIGHAIAQTLAKDTDNLIFLSGRNESKLQESFNQIRKKYPASNLEISLVDLSSKTEIENLVSKWKGTLDVLINNAAVTPKIKQLNAEGVEMQFAVNVLSYFYLTKLFLPILQNSIHSRIVNVASYWAGDLELSDMQFEKRTYNNNTAYRQSKQANRMLSTVFAKHNPSISINACHPGEVNSKLSNDLGFAGHESPELGADTPAWLATSKEVEGLSGCYFEYRKQKQCQFSIDKNLMDKLFKLCEGFC